MERFAKQLAEDQQHAERTRELLKRVYGELDELTEPAIINTRRRSIDLYASGGRTLLRCQRSFSEPGKCCPLSRPVENWATSAG